jgi:hypothetical protein
MFPAGKLTVVPTPEEVALKLRETEQLRKQDTAVAATVTPHESAGPFPFAEPPLELVPTSCTQPGRTPVSFPDSSPSVVPAHALQVELHAPLFPV